MSSQISSPGADSGSRNMFLIGGLALVLALGGIYYWYQYSKEKAALEPGATIQAPNSALRLLEGELGSVETENLSTELEGIKNELGEQ